MFLFSFKWLFSEVIRVLQRNQANWVWVCRCVCVRLLHELANADMEAGKYQVCRMSRQDGDQAEMEVQLQSDLNALQPVQLMMWFHLDGWYAQDPEKAGVSVRFQCRKKAYFSV